MHNQLITFQILIVGPWQRTSWENKEVNGTDAYLKPKYNQAATSVGKIERKT